MDTITPDYNYLDKLNEQQREAVVYHDGPELVIAGAGSGKTRVLTYKVVDLLRHGFEPWRLMVLTFTNKAADEMKQRVADAVGEKVASKIWMGTFHSIFLRILRLHADRLGYKSSFTIYNASDSKALVKNIIEELGLDDKLYRPATVAAIISNAKNDLVDAAAYAADAGCMKADDAVGRPRVWEIFSLYEKRCRLAQAMDFDDILLKMNVLLRDNPDIAQYYRDFFRYILVDEYQDTNLAQHIAITQLTGEGQHVCVVGDDAQSIYSFRGAAIDNILTLSNYYPTLKIFKLERNYRSTQTIIDAASSLIAKNKRQMEKHVFSENEIGERIDVVQNYSDIEEAHSVVAAISRTRFACHDSYEDYAVLYRTNSQSRALEEELRRRGIGYRVHGGLSFYQRKEVLDAVAYFRLTVNPDDDQALLRVINYPARGIGKTTLAKVRSAAMANDVSLWTVVADPQRFSLDINAGTARKLRTFAELITSFKDDAEKPANDAYTMVQTIVNRTRMIAVLESDKTPEAISRRENLSELLAGAKAFTMQAVAEDEDASLGAFLSEISLATDQDSDGDEESSGKVTLMTVHASKGLEYKHIYIVGLEEELFPSALSSGSEKEIEEERRLLYVAITRAKETCMLSYATSRFRNGQTVQTRPSRFLSDIDRKYLHLKTSDDLGASSTTRTKWGSPRGFSWRPKKEVPRESTPSLSAQKEPVFRPVPANAAIPAVNGTKHDLSELKTGMRIAHSSFGKGTIELIDDNAGSPLIHVNFDGDGVRRLMLKFAKFEIL